MLLKPSLPKLAVFSLSLALLMACATRSSESPNISGQLLIHGQLQGQPLLALKETKPPYQLAVVLGGGGLRGYAHIGVLQALNEAGIYPDLIVGTSVGAVVGAAYASGLMPRDIWHTAENQTMLHLADITLSGPGIVKGEALADWMNRLVRGRSIEQLPIRFAAVATDIDQASPYVITAGDTGEAVRASAAIPGIFIPVKITDHVLVDGGVASLVPVSAAKALGAQKIIAVDIYCDSPRYSTDSMPSMWLLVSQVQSCLLATSEKATANIVITPSVIAPELDDPKSRERARESGYRSTLTALPLIQKMLTQAN